MGVNFVNCNQLGTGTVMKLLWHPSIDHVKVNTSTSENSETRRKKKIPLLGSKTMAWFKQLGA